MSQSVKLVVRMRGKGSTRVHDSLQEKSSMGTREENKPNSRSILEGICGFLRLQYKSAIQLSDKARNRLKGEF